MENLNYESNYDFHFIIREQAEEFERQFEYFVENTEKWTKYSVPIQKEYINVKTIIYKMGFINFFYWHVFN